MKMQGPARSPWPAPVVIGSLSSVSSEPELNLVVLALRTKMEVEKMGVVWRLGPRRVFCSRPLSARFSFVPTEEQSKFANSVAGGTSLSHFFT